MGQNEEFLWVSQAGVGAEEARKLRTVSSSVPAPPATGDACHFMAPGKKYGEMQSHVLRDKLRNSPVNLNLISRKRRSETNTGQLGAADIV